LSFNTLPLNQLKNSSLKSFTKPQSFLELELTKTLPIELTNTGFHPANQPMWKPSPTNLLTTHGHDNSMRQ
ncbi:hypothetical protein, partial [Vibrio cholerae]